MFEQSRLWTKQLRCSVQSGWDWELGGTLRGDVSYEPVSAFRYGFYENRLLRLVAQYPADLQYVFSYDFRVYIGFRPKGLKKLVLGNE